MICADYCARLASAGQGDVLVSIMEVADEELSKPAKAINRTRLQSLLEMGEHCTHRRFTICYTIYYHMAGALLLANRMRIDSIFRLYSRSCSRKNVVCCSGPARRQPKFRDGSALPRKAVRGGSCSRGAVIISHLRGRQQQSFIVVGSKYYSAMTSQLAWPSLRITCLPPVHGRLHRHNIMRL